MSDVNTSPALEVAKEQRDEQGDRVVILSTGVRVRLRTVNAATISEVTSRIKDPEVPRWFNPDKGREEENPNHPAYLSGLDRANQERANAMFDALALFGVELEDDAVLDDDGWLNELRLLERLGRLDLSRFDLSDPLDRRFLYVKHVAMGTQDWSKLMRLAGISPEAVAEARRSFRGDS